MGVSDTNSPPVQVGPVAVRYATALFQLAREKAQLERVTLDVATIADLLAHPEKSEWLFDARLPAKEKRKRIESLVSGMSPVTANFLRLVADKRRLDLLRELPWAFKRCVLQDRGAVEGVVESARPIVPGELAELAVTLGAILKKEVTLHARVVPELLAGARILVDNRMLDVSAQGRLESLRAKLLSARLG